MHLIPNLAGSASKEILHSRPFLYSNLESLGFSSQVSNCWPLFLRSPPPLILLSLVLCTVDARFSVPPIGIGASAGSSFNVFSLLNPLLYNPRTTTPLARPSSHPSRCHFCDSADTNAATTNQAWTSTSPWLNVAGKGLRAKRNICKDHFSALQL